MSNTVLIGVGGSGQHVVHAYLRLLALTNVDPTTIPKIYIIDADDSSADQKESLSNQIEQLYTSLTSTVKKDGQEQSKKTRNVKVIRPFYQKDDNYKPNDAADALGVSHVVAPLANAFLMDDGDKTVDVARGMMANARIGSAVFHSKKIQVANDTQTDVNFGNLFDVINKDTRVAIVGSSFGGTGSGVIPTLIRELDKKPSKIIQAFMTLPWFEITKAKKNDKSAAGTDNGINPMQRNAMLGLRTYLDESKKFKKSNYVISQFVIDKTQTLPEREDNGNFNQHETKHIYNLVLANSIQHFLSNDNPSLDDAFKAPTLDNPEQGRHILGLLLGEEERKGIFDATTSPHLRLHIAKDDNRSLQNVFMDANMTAFVLEKAAEAIKAASVSDKQEMKVKSGDEASPAPEGFKNLLEAISVALGKEVKKTPKFFGLGKIVGKDDKIRTFQIDVYIGLANSLIHIATRLSESISWLYDHKVDSNTNQKTGFQFTPPNLTKEWETNWQHYGFKNMIRRSKNIPIIHNDGAEDNKNKTAQAFFLFENIFFDGHEKNRKGYTAKFDLENAIKAQPQKTAYDIAAELITKQIFEEVRAVRSITLITDIQDNQTDKRTKLMLKNDVMKQHTKAQQSLTARLATVEGLYQDIQSDYEMLDPYLGIPRNGIEQLRAKTIIFPETALKGIPNIIAPLLLQKWRLDLFDKNQETWKVSSPSPLTADDSLFSTEYGVYLHARRIIEAAFWLLFTSNTSVKLETLSDSSQDLFSELLKEELDKFNTLKPLKFYIQSNDSKTKGMPLFLYDDKMGWYLAANKTARQFLAEVMPELPSVKYGHSKLDSLWRGEEYQTKPTAKPETYDTGVINAFLGYLQQISNNPQLAENKPTWLKACDDLIRDLEGKGFISADLKNVRLEDSKEPLPLLGQKVGITLKTLQGAESASLANLAITNPIFYYKTDNNDNLSPLQPKELLWPLKGEAWQYLQAPQEKDAVNDFGGVPKLLSNDTRSVWSWETLHLNFKGLGKKTFNKPFNHVVGLDANNVNNSDSNSEPEQFYWSVGVWPNFVLDDWNYYIAIGDFNCLKIENIDLRGHDLKGESVEFIFYGDTNGQFQELGRSLHAIPIKLKGVPRSVEIVLAGRVLGSVPITLNTPTPEVSQPCKVALDFGTSNTCMAVNFEGHDAKHLPLLEGQQFRHKVESVYKTTELKNLTWSTGNFESSSAGIKAYYHQLLPTLFFQSFASKSQGITSIPSELLWAKGLGKGVETTANRLKYLQSAEVGKRYYSEFSLLTSFGGDSPEQCLFGRIPVVAPFWTPFPPAISENLVIQLKDHKNNTYVDGFKWDSESVGNKRYAHRAVYLENILVAAFATLRLSGCKILTEIIATYPGAFSSQTVDGKKADTESYKEDLSLIIDKLSQQTGIAITHTAEHKPAISLRSETCAALAGCSRDKSEISLTIDMGGGTTDIGLIIPDKDQPKDTAKLKYYMASLRYAGTDLLKAIVNYDKIKKPNETEGALFLEWKLKLRAGEKIALGSDKPAYNRIASAFFDGLFEYVFNMLMAFKDSLPADKEVNVYLFGNGFKLAQIFCGVAGDEKEEEKRFIENIVAKAKQYGLLDANIKLKLQQKGVDKKQGLIDGVFKIQEEGEVGEQYAYIEKQGHGTKPLILPCVIVSGQSSSQPYLIEKEDEYEKFVKALDNNVSTTDAWQQRKTAFKLTNNYWQHQDVNPNALFTQVIIKKHASDFGKYYLENGFVGEVLYKLVTEQKAPVQEQVRKVEQEITTTNTPPQQSGFKPSSVSEMAAPPAPNVPPQNPIQESSHRPSSARVPVVLPANKGHQLKTKNLVADFEWQNSGQLVINISAFLLTTAGKVNEEQCFVFYGQNKYKNGVVLKDDKRLALNLTEIPTDIDKIALCVTLYKPHQNQHFGQVSNVCIKLHDGDDVLSFTITEETNNKTALLLGEIYRYNGEWRFKGKGGGWKGGLAAMCEIYGFDNVTKDKHGNVLEKVIPEE